MRISDFKYKVSFNCEIGGIGVGDEHQHTVDYVGNDLQELIKEVLEDPYETEYVGVVGQEIIGYFRDKAHPDFIVALLYKGDIE
jgi:hypothetical protein